MVAQVLSKNLLDTNELLKNHQTQVQTLGDKLKVVEDEKALVADKLALAQRELTARDTSMLQLKSEAHALQQVLSRTSFACPPARASRAPRTEID
jgi:chromosome segregation ATPase